MMIKRSYSRVYRILFIVMAGVILNSCEQLKPKPLALPEATQTGENTFGCKINGEIWVANGNSNYRSIESPSYNVETGNFGFDGWNTKDFEGRVYVAVSCNNCFDVGMYTDMYPYSEYFLGSIGNIVQGGGYLNTTGTSKVEITRFAPEKGIMSGTFEYDLYDKTNGQKIKITEGRFDLSGVYVY